MVIKYHGAIDMQTIGINNMSKVEGYIEAICKQINKTKEQIKQLLKNEKIDIKVRFISVEDDKTTPMCHSLDEQIFSVNKINKFKRYYGTTYKDLKLKTITCKGLVLGLNMPPINHHFHYCRSTLVYQTDISRTEVDKMLNRNFAFEDITNKFKTNKKHKVIEQQYFIDDNGNKYNIDDKNVKIKANEKERQVAELLGEMYGGKVKLIPVVLNPQGIKTPDYMIKDRKFDLKEPTGSSSTTIYDLFKHKSKQADNFVIDIHKSGLDRLESIEQVEKIYYSKHRMWINTIILIDNNEIFKVLKRKQ